MGDGRPPLAPVLEVIFTISTEAGKPHPLTPENVRATVGRMTAENDLADALWSFDGPGADVEHGRIVLSRVQTLAPTQAPALDLASLRDDAEDVLRIFRPGPDPEHDANPGDAEAPACRLAEAMPRLCGLLDLQRDEIGALDLEMARRASVLGSARLEEAQREASIAAAERDAARMEAEGLRGIVREARTRLCEGMPRPDREDAEAALAILNRAGAKKGGDHGQ